MNDKLSYSNLGDAALWGNLRRALFCAVLTALPLCGLVLFFEMTRPAHISGAGHFSAQIANAHPVSAALDESNSWLSANRAITRFQGVSAELRLTDPSRSPAVLTASDAEQAIADAPFVILKVGFQTEFLNKDRHRISLRVASRQLMTDQAVPNNVAMADITPASSTRLVTFVWGEWIYRVEIQDKGLEPEIAVQKVL